MLSLKPRFADALLDGTKSVELRRTRIAAPAGTRLILYASAPVMAVVGVATLIGNEIDVPARIWRCHSRYLGLSRSEYDDYLVGATKATALTIGEPHRLLEPPTLAVLRAESGFRAPQSYRYLTTVDPYVLHRAVALPVS